MCFVLQLQAVLQISPGRLLDLQLIKGSAGSGFSLAAVRLVLQGKLSLIPRCLLLQLVGLPRPGKARTHGSAEQEGQQHPPRSERHQISTCSARS